MASPEEIKIEVGQSVDVSLESMMGSTGYGWELTALKGSVNLVGISVQPTSTRALAPVIQIFSFRGVGEGSGKAVFGLTAPWKVEEPKKQITYVFNVVKADDADTDDNLRLEGFTAPPTATVRAAGLPRALYAVNPPPQPLYGVPTPIPVYSAPLDPCVYYGVCPPGDDCCNQPKYGVLPPGGSQPKYGIQPPPCVDDDCCAPPVVMKYNVPMMRYNFPPAMRYNFPSNDPDGC
jgi:hypothetical protein